MPIARVGAKLVYFAHVPKAAGTSVEAYMEERFGPMAMLDRRHFALSEEDRWSRTSPQHVALETYRRIFPPSFFDLVFAVVRHPVARLASAYRFHQEVTRLVPKDLSFAAWLDGLDEVLAVRPFAYDNHARRMVDLVPEDATVFRLEDDLDAVVDWFDEIEGERRGPRHMLVRNTSAGAALAVVGPEETARIAERYAADFDRFGYDPEQVAPSTALPSQGLASRLRRALRGGR